MTVALALAVALAGGRASVDPALPGARDAERLLPAAQAAVEDALGPIDWSGVRVIAEPPGARTGSPVPPWAAAFAVPSRGLVVLRPDRIGRWPYGSLGQVLTHELAHLALARRLAASDVPRWFEEGAAMTVAAEAGATDLYHVSLALLFGPDLDLAGLDRRFRGDRSDAEAAYALSRSFVDYLTAAGGPDTLRRIVEEAAAGAPFEPAVERALGRSLESLEAGWRREVVILYRWLPILSSTVTLWLAITGLTFLAWARQRRRVRALRARWEIEDLELDEVDRSGPHGPN